MHVYTSKDGRERAVYKDDDGRYHTVSYPRVLMEQKLGIKLEADDDVHHLDEDHTNNDLDNLVLIKHGEHQRQHSTKYYDKIAVCDYCGSEFLWEARKQRSHFGNLGHKRSNKTNKVFCSRTCVGRFGRDIQLGRIALD